MLYNDVVQEEAMVFILGANTDEDKKKRYLLGYLFFYKTACLT